MTVVGHAETSRSWPLYACGGDHQATLTKKMRSKLSESLLC